MQGWLPHWLHWVAGSEPVDGQLRFTFLGESVLLPAAMDAATCAVIKHSV